MHATTPERVSFVDIDDVLRQTFGNRSLANASIAYQHRVILRAAHQSLHDPSYLIVPTDDGVEPALGRNIG